MAAATSQQPAATSEAAKKDGKNQQLLIGDETPTSSGYFAKLAGDPRVFTIASYNKTSLDKTYQDLRDKRLLRFNSDKLTRLELLAKGQELARTLKGQVCGLLYGYETGDLAQTVIHHGADRVLLADHTKVDNAGPGAATGRVVFNSVDAEAWAKRGEKVILTRIETSPEDIKGMNAAEGILTARGGMTSHAALVARQMGKVCVAGCGELEIDYGKRTMTIKGRTLKEGDWISIDGTTGSVYLGKIPMTAPSLEEQSQWRRPATAEPFPEAGTERETSRSRLYPGHARPLG